MIGKIEFDSIQKPKLLVNPLPPPSECPDGTIYGNYSLRLPNGWRVIYRRHAYKYGSMNDTQTAFTRCFLKSLPPRRMRKAQKEAFFNHTRAPQYCVPSESRGEAFYVDIQSAYQSIYQRMSWRIEYLRGQYFSNDSDKLIYPFPSHWKSGRSYVVTGALPGTRRYVKGGVVHSVDCVNPYLNLPLVSAVWDVLSAIARQAIDRFDARYFNLDGTVIPESRYFDYLRFLDSLGLSYRVKYRGKAKILNLGTWQIGDSATKRFGSNSVSIKTDSISVTMAESDWILDRFMRL